MLSAIWKFIKFIFFGKEKPNESETIAIISSPVDKSE